MQLFSNTAEAIGKHEVVYNLMEVAEGTYLPNAYIVSVDQDGFLAHIRQKALDDTIGAFKLELDNTRAKLFNIIEELQPKHLEKKYSPPKKKVKPIEELLADKDIQPVLLNFVHRKLDELLVVVVEQQLPLTWNVDRRGLVKDFVMQLPQKDAELDVHLYFNKTKDNVQYRFQLSEGEEKPWVVSSKEVVPITNHPAWLFVDFRLCKVADINGNMVKPFQKRDEVIIPANSVKTYFQKFILKVAAKVDIEAEGFDVVVWEELTACQLEIVPSVFNGDWVLAMQMLYPQAAFIWNDRRMKRTSLEFGENDVRIHQVRRNLEQEKRYVKSIKALGLHNPEASYFTTIEASRDPFNLLNWLLEHRPELEKAGFKVLPVQLEEKKVYLAKAQLSIHSERINDWFDIYGEVQVGEFSIPFLALARNIREENRFYALPNGEYFVIPLEWMEKFRALMQFARKEGNALRLNKSQYTLVDELGIAQKSGPVEEVTDLADYVPGSKLKADLRPYQLDGVRWLIKLYRNELGACLADDMGLGKTLQTISVLLYAKEQKAALPDGSGTGNQLDMFSEVAGDEEFLQALNALIVLPASLVFNWESELKKFAPSLSIYKHVGQRRYDDIRLLRRFDVILTTYQTALRDEALLMQMEFEYIILDESQQIKNRESKIFQSVHDLRGKHRVSLSGTPIENSLSDLWAQMQFINPDLLGNYSFFKREFITPIEKYQIEDKKIRLRNLVAPYMLRRTKEEVAKDLPPLTTQVFYSEMTPEQKKMYEREKSAARNFLLENYDENSPQYRILVLQSLTKLRQLVNHPRLISEEYTKESGKFNDILQQWDTIRRSNHKALFFSSFVQYLNLFREEFQQRKQQFSWLTGDLTANKRVEEIKKFEENAEVQSFLISIKSGGTGLNLTAADYVFILDPWWNPTTEQQAIARAHRIGQEKSVIAIKFITKDSIEEKILKLQDRKSKLAEDIIENVNRAEFSRGDIEYLLE
ncbi:DEAD/DEAH box helicase [Haliscomenobacter hydrossis]|uniref:SNF2-related protein n=1 Tax=Haliscomenobacter hydrossis (strain ATCC 27775 / DSM 1100 / LMG 10767 / O) TaxID=760192 RepID=F4KTK3_HALH1|nr:DEAD/DEAH box helicase [Haliscomenobacter hydrossis]AEE53377.1 SNF2-related protein [Haliscomenobacter hydrossis DSM 1100]